MAETRREWDALMALLPTSGSGEIEATDIRDACYSLLPNVGIIYVASGDEAATTLGSTDWIKASGTTTSVLLDAFTMPANNRILYSGTPDRRVFVWGFTSVETASADRTLQVGLYHYDASGASGSVIAHSPIQHYHVDTNTYAAATFGTCLMETNDYVELHLKNSSADNATANNLCLAAIGIPVLV